ncbi:hypothetical protein ACWE42_08230 [Sutcliffiella cohnii]
MLTFIVVMHYFREDTHHSPVVYASIFQRYAPLPNGHDKQHTLQTQSFSMQTTLR